LEEAAAAAGFAAWGPWGVEEASCPASPPWTEDEVFPAAVCESTAPLAAPEEDPEVVVGVPEALDSVTSNGARAMLDTLPRASRWKATTE